MNLIQKLEQEEIQRLGRKIPAFAPGDTVIVKVTVVEGDKKREQAYEGVVIAIRNRGLNSSFIVRKMSSGEGVERTFQTYAPSLASIEVKRKETRDGKSVEVEAQEKLGPGPAEVALALDMPRSMRERPVASTSFSRSMTSSASRASSASRR